MTIELSLGIDPGWKNLGISLVMEEPNLRVRVLGSETLNPSEGDYQFVAGLPWRIKAMAEKAGLIWDDKSGCILKNVVVERYVPYNNVFGTETENITMLIGMIRQRFSEGTPVSNYGVLPENLFLYRAIDWKAKLAQLMSKHAGFHNPAISLDKKYSLAMARFLTRPQHADPKTILEEKGNKFEPSYLQVDHEADATCLASLPIIAKQLHELSKPKVGPETNSISVGAQSRPNRTVSFGAGSVNDDINGSWPDSVLGK